ncbi:MAG TPA: serine/threonine-protein kinase, partial [Gemmataceae bacterium]|nr:serine/threonine-protein kinase [Gemmataceae bacterium]
MSCGTLKSDLSSVGRYDFLQLVGKGGMGSVYKATDQDTGNVVAVKVLDVDLSANPELLYRFVQEFQAAAKLEHPNIVRAIDFGSDGPLSYMVSEFVEGVNLGEMIAERGRMAEDDAVRIITQIAQALHYAHAGRVIHRDVKPDNVLIRTDGVAKLADFGLAKDYDNDQGLTLPARGLGTPHFMAPEQYRDAKNAGTACDIYALGATLYNAVTGRLPFEGCESLVALAKKAKGDIPAPRELVPGLSARVDEAIRRAMDPHPGRRPASCLEFFKLLSGRFRPAARRKAGGGLNRLASSSGLPADRRAWVRHPLTLGTTCTIDTTVCGGESESRESWPLIVQDVSAGGLGMLLARRVE